MSNTIVNPKLVIFDVDGVLVDSLTKHLDFCRDMAKDRELNIRIPSEEVFRENVSNGQRVSPMRIFFRAVGFPEVFIDRLDAEYQSNFDPKYRATMFPGILSLLKRLRKSQIKLGLVTSNSRKNIESVLGPATLKLFDRSCRFYRDDGESKSELIRAAMHVSDIRAEDCVYVGDQPDDLLAAKEAGCRFVGVTYGWGFPRRSLYAEMANTPSSLTIAIERAVKEFPLEAKLEYAWNWFDYHADQRVKMFNYMFVGLGLFATAIIAALDKGIHFAVPVTLCFVASILAAAFYFLDRRNEYLVSLGEEVLFALERRDIFGASSYFQSRFQGSVSEGILLRQQRETPARARGVGRWWDHAVRGRHRFWLRAIAALLAAMFLCAGFVLMKFDVKLDKSTLQIKSSQYERHIRG